MKLFMVANKNEQSKRYKTGNIEVLLKAQIHNCIEVGWKPDNIILLSNFVFEYMKVKTRLAKLNDFCWTGSKLFALKWYMEKEKVKDIIWAKDLDCWQNIWFDCPKFDGDVGASQYSNPKFNGGSIFWKSQAKDIIDEVLSIITTNKAVNEEPTLNKVFKSKEYKDRVSVLNYTYNVWCSGFVPRYERSKKPIHVCHFHPYNQVAWEIHALDRDDSGVIAVTIRLERLLRKYYNLASILKKKRSKDKK